jgi:hypothetical protein
MKDTVARGYQQGVVLGLLVPVPDTGFGAGDVFRMNWNGPQMLQQD